MACGRSVGRNFYGWMDGWMEAFWDCFWRPLDVSDRSIILAGGLFRMCFFGVKM